MNSLDILEQPVWLRWHSHRILTRGGKMTKKFLRWMFLEFLNSDANTSTNICRHLTSTSAVKLTNDYNRTRYTQLPVSHALSKAFYFVSVCVTCDTVMPKSQVHLVLSTYDCHWLSWQHLCCGRQAEKCSHKYDVKLRWKASLFSQKSQILYNAMVKGQRN